MTEPLSHQARAPDGALQRAERFVGVWPSRTDLLALLIDDDPSTRFSDRMVAHARQFMRSLLGDAERAIGSCLDEEDAQKLGDAEAYDVLHEAGLLNDPDILEIVDREVRLAELRIALDDPDAEPALAAYLDHDRPKVAKAAMALLTASSRSRHMQPMARGSLDDLPAETLAGLLDLVAAGLSQVTDVAPDRLLRAASKVLADHDEGASVASLANRLARLLSRDKNGAMDVRPHVDGVDLFTARVAHAAQLDHGDVVRAAGDPTGLALAYVMRGAGYDSGVVLEVMAALYPEVRTNGDAIRSIDGKVAADWLRRMARPARYRRAVRRLRAHDRQAGV